MASAALLRLRSDGANFAALRAINDFCRRAMPEMHHEVPLDYWSGAWDEIGRIQPGGAEHGTAPHALISRRGRTGERSAGGQTGQRHPTGDLRRINISRRNWGSPLFDRSPRGLKLTTAGRFYLGERAVCCSGLRSAGLASRRIAEELMGYASAWSGKRQLGRAGASSSRPLPDSGGAGRPSGTGALNTPEQLERLRDGTLDGDLVYLFDEPPNISSTWRSSSTGRLGGAGHLGICRWASRSPRATSPIDQSCPARRLPRILRPPPRRLPAGLGMTAAGRAGSVDRSRDPVAGFRRHRRGDRQYRQSRPPAGPAPAHDLADVAATALLRLAARHGNDNYSRFLDVIASRADRRASPDD